MCVNVLLRLRIERISFFALLVAGYGIANGVPEYVGRIAAGLGGNAALYLRLSRDEEAKQESNSITNQRQILADYATQQGYNITDRKINMVICKDLSRLGREHIGTGQYIEQIFPRMGVRFIAIGDNYDSLYDDEPSADMVPMINFFNEFHAKQTSRKTRTTKKSLAKAGKFQGSKPPHGYIKDPADKYHLLVDPVIQRAEEDWIVTENTHEPIIDQRTWDLTHEKLKVRKHSDNHGAIQMFAGLVKCADCGYALAYTRNGSSPYYQCSQYNVKGKNYCSSHFIRYDELYDVVLHDVRRRARAASGMDQYMLQNLKREAAGQLTKKLREAEKEFKAIDSRISELDIVIGRLCEDSALGRISSTRFDTLLHKYETEQAELKQRHIEVKKELAEQQKRQDENEQLMEMIAAYRTSPPSTAPFSTS